MLVLLGPRILAASMHLQSLAQMFFFVYYFSHLQFYVNFHKESRDFERISNYNNLPRMAIFFCATPEAPNKLQLINYSSAIHQLFIS